MTGVDLDFITLLLQPSNQAGDEFAVCALLPHLGSSTPIGFLVFDGLAPAATRTSAGWLCASATSSCTSMPCWALV